MTEIKLFLLDAEVAEVLENIESLQHLQTFIHVIYVLKENYLIQNY